MKRIAFIALMAMMLVMPAVALDFEILPRDSVYEPYRADLWATDICLHFMNMLTIGPTEMGVVTERIDGREYWHDNPDESLREHTVIDTIKFTEEDRAWSYARFMLAQQLQLLRINHDWISAEAIANGGINMIFEASGSTDILGFDGFYFIGGAVELFDMVSFKAGIQHYSGHYGDEVFENLEADDYGNNYKDRMDWDDGTPGKIYVLEHYVRQNAMLVGLSATPLPWLRVYAQLDFLPNIMHVISPWFLMPEDTPISDRAEYEDESLEHRMGVREGNYTEDYQTRNNPYPSNYRDRKFEFGVEASIPVCSVGNVVLAFDCLLDEEGRTGYQVGAFSDEYGWTKNFDFLVGFEFTDSGFSVEMTYHKGQFPLTHFFFHECSYWSIGATYRP